MFHRAAVYRIVLLYWLIPEIRIEAYQCDNGRILQNDAYFCDGDGAPNDCGDGSDEGYGCDRTRCGNGKFSCDRFPECKPISVRCNGAKDCFDGSDEDYCVFFGGKRSMNPENCTLLEGRFLCSSRNSCITFDRMCDNVCDCRDCSDENSVNCYAYDGNSCRSCLNRCWPSPNGPQCVCSASHSDSSEQCRGFQDYATNDSCDQNCIRYDFRITQCECFENFHYVPGTNGSECQTIASHENILLYSTFLKIKSLNLTSGQAQILKPNVVNCTALSASRNSTYYASFRNDKAIIFEITNTSAETRKIIETSTIITSLAVDWITENIYFTNNGSVSVCANSGSICVRLDCCDEDYVVLAPKFGWMYYTEKSTYEHERIIVKSNMDGSEKNVFFIDGSFFGCTSLAIDEVRETLYWYESEHGGLEKIHFISLHGSERRVNTRQTIDGILLSTSFTVLDKTVFFTKPIAAHGNVIYYNRNAGHVRDYKDSETNAITNLYAFNNLFRSMSKIEDPCAASSCHGLCLLRPSTSSDRLNSTCMCQNYTMTSGTLWCSRPSAQPSEIKINLSAEVEPEVTLVTEQITFANKEYVKVAPAVQRLLPKSGTSTSTTLYTVPTHHPTNFTLSTAQTVTQPSTAVKAPVLENASSSNASSLSSALSPTQGSQIGGVLIGIFVGIILTLAIHVFYFTFKKLYLNRNDEQMSIRELMNLQL